MGSSFRDGDGRSGLGWVFRFDDITFFYSADLLPSPELGTGSYSHVTQRCLHRDQFNSCSIVIFIMLIK